MTSCYHHHHHSACGCSSYSSCSGSSFCPYPQWMHPICCNPAHYCDAGCESGPTLVIHQIVLEPSGSQSCTPRTFSLRVTGPSYPGGEVFTLRAGSCTELDEPLVISGLTPGQYTIELLGAGSCAYDSTITGPVCDGTVVIPESCVPTVITIVSRRRLRSRCRCGCSGSCAGCSCPQWCCGQSAGCGYPQWSCGHSTGCARSC